MSFTAQETEKLEVRVYITAIARALVEKGVLTKEEISTLVSDLCPPTEAGKLIASRLISSISKWE